MSTSQEVATLKAKLEALTGKMVSFRSRKAYNATQRRLQAAARKKAREAE